jgi:hypothetical protein
MRRTNQFTRENGDRIDVTHKLRITKEALNQSELTPRERGNRRLLSEKYGRKWS